MAGLGTAKMAGSRAGLGWGVRRLCIIPPPSTLRLCIMPLQPDLMVVGLSDLPAPRLSAPRKVGGIGECTLTLKTSFFGFWVDFWNPVPYNEVKEEQNMATWQVYAIYSISKHIGTVEAEDRDEAEANADEELEIDGRLGLCYQCSTLAGDDADLDQIIVSKEDPS